MSCKESLYFCRCSFSGNRHLAEGSVQDLLDIVTGQCLMLKQCTSQGVQIAFLIRLQPSTHTDAALLRYKHRK